MKDLTIFDPPFKTLVGFLTGNEDNTLQNILSEVSRKSGISEELIKSKSKKRELVEARHIYCKRAMARTTKTVNVIGELINLSHSMVSVAADNVDKIPSLRAKYKSYFGMGSPSKPVEMIKNNDVIRSFDSITSASEAMKISRGNIRYCITGKRSHAGGFKWKYAE